MEDEVLHLLKHHDVELVEMAIGAMSLDVDLSIEIERVATSFFLAARSPDSGLPNPVGGWREDMIQPFCIEKVEVGPVKEQAQRFGLDRDFLEHPIQRQNRLFHGSRAMLNVTLIFEPTGKFVTKNVPRVQLSWWEMIQTREKQTTNPPRLHLLRHTANGKINTALMHEHEKRPPNVGQSSKLANREKIDTGTISTISSNTQRSVDMSTNTNESASTVVEPCRVCGTLSAMRCSLCHKVHYCSSEHIRSVRIQISIILSSHRSPTCRIGLRIALTAMFDRLKMLVETLVAPSKSPAYSSLRTKIHRASSKSSV